MPSTLMTLRLDNMSHQCAMRKLFGAAIAMNHHVHDAAQDRQVREIAARRHAEAVREANDAPTHD